LLRCCRKLYETGFPEIASAEIWVAPVHVFEHIIPEIFSLTTELSLFGIEKRWLAADIDSHRVMVSVAAILNDCENVRAIAIAQRAIEPS
jgi:hypothetical protein